MGLCVTEPLGPAQALAYLSEPAGLLPCRAGPAQATGTHILLVLGLSQGTVRVSTSPHREAPRRGPVPVVSMGAVPSTQGSSVIVHSALWFGWLGPFCPHATEPKRGPHHCTHTRGTCRHHVGHTWQLPGPLLLLVVQGLCSIEEGQGDLQRRALERAQRLHHLRHMRRVLRDPSGPAMVAKSAVTLGGDDEKNRPTVL